MDIGVLRVDGETGWKRLGQLTRQRSLSGNEIDEFDRLYHSTIMDLARIRMLSPDPEVITELLRTLSAMCGHLAGTGDLSGAAIARFFTVPLPLMLYRIRWVTLAMTAASITIAGVQVHCLVSYSNIMNELGTPEQLKYYAQNAFVEYYHQGTNAEFGLSVWTNNAWITLVGITIRITGVYPPKILWENAMSTDTPAVVVSNYGGVWRFFHLVLLYGLPELTVIFISIAAGPQVLWSLSVPGPMTCFQTVGQTIHSVTTVTAGCAVLLAGSGVLEGFMTPSGPSDAVKITLSALMTAAVWVYILILGWRTH